MPDQQTRTSERTGRPPLTERRKAETRLEVARAAVRLFLAKGVAGTSAEEIAAEAGISVRTLWRYFPSKESCVMPLLTGGIEHTAECLRAWRRDQGVSDLLAMLTSGRIGSPGEVVAMMNLVRLARTDPGLRAVWLEAHREAEPAFAEALAHRAGLAEPDLVTAIQAAMINSALRVTVEHHAFNTETPESLAAATAEALVIAAQGLPT
ncbi:TetR/AcrR family transcriptional regulator [Lentzea aerocolonigenes]|uniref:TetR/AcrR family transcriptional regulator n=1 Tax=Lentzea aerocolonigenes TaxID=68170 RepID=UPI0004C41625|nr:TetR/AcrR family transcriptional regulator [Lentzea aerocolonigenes]MCP2248071.1 transcriptional regulator, TetR family [Lentzea aerocolonigenes]